MLKTKLALGIAYSASVGGMATILGGAANAVAPGVDILADSLRNELSIVFCVPVIEVARSAV